MARVCWNLICVALSSVLLSGCGETTPPAQTNLGPEGATLTLANGAVVIIVPAEAVSEPVLITVDAASNVPSSPLLVAGTAFEIGPSGLQFAAPVSLSIRYQGLTLPQDVRPEELRVNRVSANAWVELSGSGVDSQGGTVSVQISGLSVFGLVAVPADSVIVEPSALFLAGGQSSQLSATPLDADGNTLPDRAVSWSSSASAIASVDQNGLVTAVGQGNATITAMVEEVSGSAAVQVTAAAVWFQETYDNYQSTAELESDPRNIYDVDSAADGEGTISLDTTVQHPQGIFNNALSIFIPAQACGNEPRYGKNLSFPDAATDQPRELWIEMYIRFTSNWTTVNGCSGNEDHKTIFFGSNASSNRWELKFGQNNGSYIGVRGQVEVTVFRDSRDVQGDNSPIPASRYWDGQWHQIRAHLKMNSATGVADGALEFWLDGQKTHEAVNVDLQMGPGHFTGFALGRNINQSPQQDQTFWFGDILVWISNPNWEF